MSNNLTQEELVTLLRRYEELHTNGKDYSHIISTLEQETQFPDVAQHLQWAMIENMSSAESVAEFLSIYQPEKPKLSREKMIQLVERIMAAEGSQAGAAKVSWQNARL